MSLIEITVPAKVTSLPLPLVSAIVPAGFPTSFDDGVERVLDLNEYVTVNRTATFFVKVCGESMVDAGVHDGDLLVVDKDRKPEDGSVVVASVDGMVTVKKLGCKNGEAKLVPENKEYKPIEISEFTDCIIWGVVTYSVHKHC